MMAPVLPRGESSSPGAAVGTPSPKVGKTGGVGRLGAVLVELEDFEDGEGKLEELEPELGLGDTVNDDCELEGFGRVMGTERLLGVSVNCKNKVVNGNVVDPGILKATEVPKLLAVPHPNCAKPSSNSFWKQDFPPVQVNM